MLKFPAMVVAVAGAGLLAAAAEVRADSYSSDSSSDYVTPSGPYLGGGWGRFNLKLDNLDDVGTAVNSIVHSNDDAWKIDVGYRFSPYLGIEGDYMNFGRPGDTFEGTGSSGNYQLHMSGFAPFLVGTLPAGPVEIFAKAGYLFYNSDLKVNLNAPGQEVLESTHSRSDFIFGGGLGVTLFRHLNFNVEYDAVRVENARSSNVLWLATAWRF
jgi:opacity protein-like surface antigen